jgi:hypothetical protein
MPQRALPEEPTAERSIQLLLMETIDLFFEPDAGKGCMLALAATNCNAKSIDVQQDLAARGRAQEHRIRLRIAAGEVGCELAVDADVDALAGLVVNSMYGLSIKARYGASRDQLRKGGAASDVRRHVDFSRPIRVRLRSHFGHCGSHTCG